MFPGFSASYGNQRYLGIARRRPWPMRLVTLDFLMPARQVLTTLFHMFSGPFCAELRATRLNRGILGPLERPQRHKAVPESTWLDSCQWASVKIIAQPPPPLIYFASSMKTFFPHHRTLPESIQALASPKPNAPFKHSLAAEA